MSRVIGYRLPWPSAGAILFVAPVVAVRVDVAAAEDLRAGFADDVDGVWSVTGYVLAGSKSTICTVPLR